MNLIGPMEARLLAVERRQARIDDDLRDLKREAIALHQGIWDAWSQVRVPQAQQAQAPTHPLTISGCGTLQLPGTIPYVDSEFGSGTLQWDGVSNWIACKAGLSFGGVITFALHYTFSNTGSLGASWAGDGSFRPVNSTCATATTYNGIPYTGQGLICSPFTRTFVANSSLAIRTLYQNSTSTVTIGPI